jgi:hypothetical protein
MFFPLLIFQGILRLLFKLLRLYRGLTGVLFILKGGHDYIGQKIRMNMSFMIKEVNEKMPKI